MCSLEKNGWLIDKYKGTLSEERTQANLERLGSFMQFAAEKLGSDHVRAMLVPHRKRRSRQQDACLCLRFRSGSFA